MDATAEFTAGQGRLSLPDFVAQPIDIESGTFNIKYQPKDGSFDVVDSAIVVGGARADLSGNVAPLRTSDGKLSAVKIQLKAHNVALNANDKNRNIIVDRVEFTGQAGVTDASLSIDDFVVMSGNTGVRMRGTLSSGEKSPAIHLAGRVRDISSDFLKTIWPPIVAPQSRKWINENVVTGRVSEGTFQINLNADALAKADIDKRLPKDSVDLTFTLQDVTAHYFKNLPVFAGASGKGRQIDNDFQLDIDTAQTTLGQGQTVKLNSGSFIAKNVLLAEVPGIFAFDISAPVETMLAFASQPDINLLKAGMNDFPTLKGTANATIGLKFPLVDNVPKDRVDFTTDVKLTNVNVANVLPGVDLNEGNFNVDLLTDAIKISGPAKLNGITAQINWQKPKAGGQAKISLNANLDEATREKIGMKLTDYISGPMPVQASIEKDGKGNANLAVTADLSAVKMKLAAISWKRDATPGTKATFNVRNTSEGRSIENFALDGDGLHLRGNIKTSLKGKLQSVVMDQIKLDEENIFSARVVPGEGTVDLVLTGKNFDARPYIKTLVSPAPPKPAGAPTTAEGQDFTMRAHFDRVTANRGEILTNVDAVLRARASKIAEADITGTFLSGQPMSITVVPLPTGREFRITTNDGGSVLRAANFYSKIAGGQLRFYALLGNEEGSPIHNGRLDIQNFDVRNEATLAELDQRGKPKKSGPRKEGINFQRLFLPFTSDDKFVRLGNVILKGTDMCATADGVIRKADNALDVTGTVIPACGLSGLFNNVPLLGDILSGGDNNEGLFGVTYFVGGTFAKPEVKINPLSALAPGIFRRLFDYSPKKSPGRAVN
ncbi:MAG: AsmA-like C-terminal domain-containing protein, partial [Alphaproteobacteria bacterium]|nr:AsmA-like C-terminal domain-containing protein [Alphaproteobacteria bacterium]